MRNELLVSDVRAFETEVARLNKKAAKIGVPPIRINSLGNEIARRLVVVSSEGEIVNEKTVPVDVVRFEVITPDVEDRKWALCATITPVEGEKPFVEANLKGFDVTPWQSADPCRCDHCRVNRFRSISYVVQNRETAAVMQLGRDCFEDYVGKDTLRAMEFAAFIAVSLDGGEEGFYPSSGRGGIQAVETIRCVITAEAIAQLAGGWRNNEKDDFGEVVSPGTHRQAAIFLNGRMLGLEYTGAFRVKGSLSDAIENLVKTTDLQARCAESIARIRDMEVPAGDEFAQTLKTIAEYQYIPVKKASIAAYIRQFLRNFDRKAAFEAKKATTAHVGTVGARMDFTGLKVIKIHSFDSQFGTTFINIFEDANGNELIWKTGGSSFNVGEIVNLKGTVKEHGERNGAKQTILSRCKVLE